MSHENRLDLAGLSADEILAISSVLSRDAELRKREDKRVKWLKFKTVGTLSTVSPTAFRRYVSFDRSPAMVSCLGRENQVNSEKTRKSGQWFKEFNRSAEVAPSITPKIGTEFVERIRIWKHVILCAICRELNSP